VVITHKREGIVTSHSSDSAPVNDSDLNRDNFYNQFAINQAEKPGARARAAGCQCEKCQKYQLENQIYVPLVYESYDDIKPKEVVEVTEHQYFLCNSHLYGFILKDRRYGKLHLLHIVSAELLTAIINQDLLDVRTISEPKISVDAIDQLYMKTESNKTLLKAICRAYDSTQGGEMTFFGDIIRGKGEGHIILLHGPPGTGKTLTAGMDITCQRFNYT